MRRLAIEGAIASGDQETLDHLMGTLVTTPLAPWPVSQRNGSRLVEQLPYTTSTVYPLTFRDVRVLNDVQHESGVDDESACDEIIRESKLWGLDRFPHLVIDLYARDEQIKKDFSKWLSTYRKISGKASPKPLDQTNFDRWYQDKVLPYFDLVAWAHWRKTKVTRERIVSLLYPSDADATTDRLKAVKTLAHSVISATTYASLCNLMQ